MVLKIVGFGATKLNRLAFHSDNFSIRLNRLMKLRFSLVQEQFSVRPRYRHSCSVAILAPSTMASNFDHTTEEAT